MAIEYIIGTGIIGFCACMSHRSAKKVQVANERMRYFSEEVEKVSRECNKLDIPFNIYDIAKKYGVSVVSASFENPGDFESQKTRSRKDGTLEEYVSNGNKWVRYN